MSLLKDILEKLAPKNGGQKKSEKLTNQAVYDELIAHFKADMKELSVGRRVLYPMSFNILLHPDDYARVGSSLPFILPEVIAGFYAAIKARCVGLEGAYATPPATCWFFQFASSTIKDDGNGEVFMKPGEMVTVGSLETFDIQGLQQGRRVGNTMLSVKCQNSDVVKNNVNQEALLGMEILTNNAFIFNFDKQMSEKLGDIQATQRDRKNSLATLAYSEGGVNVYFDMLDDLIVVTGPSDSRKMDNIIVINNEAVQIGHVQIRYQKTTNRFQMCAYAKARLNQREVPLSIGGAPIWKDMAFKSDILLNDEVNLKFRASEAIIQRG